MENVKEFSGGAEQSVQSEAFFTASPGSVCPDDDVVLGIAARAADGDLDDAGQVFTTWAFWGLKPPRQPMSKDLRRFLWCR